MDGALEIGAASSYLKDLMRAYRSPRSRQESAAIRRAHLAGEAVQIVRIAYGLLLLAADEKRDPLDRLAILTESPPFLRVLAVEQKKSAVEVLSQMFRRWLVVARQRFACAELSCVDTTDKLVEEYVLLGYALVKLLLALSQVAYDRAVHQLRLHGDGSRAGRSLAKQLFETKPKILRHIPGAKCFKALEPIVGPFEDLDRWLNSAAN